MRTPKNFILAEIVMLTLIFIFSCSKSGEDSNTEETTVNVDTTWVEEAVDTSITVKKGNSNTQPLTVVIQNLESASAPVYVLIYGTKNKFLSQNDKLKKYKFNPQGKQLIAEIKDLKLGTYAIVTYQDINSNGELDKSKIGIPKEGFGFSNNYKPKLKAPNFGDCCFAYNAKTNSVTIRMIQP